MEFKINPSVEGKPLKALQYLIQLTAMPFVAAYLASTGMSWILAAFIGIVTSFLVVLPFAFIVGTKAFIEVFKESGEQNQN